MSSFVPRAVASTLAEPDPSKHVNYTLGMVLGVDDFKQEFAYLSGRNQWTARDLFGYGTVSGLQVNVEVENNAPQALVTPGVAVSPRGHLMRVAPAQCADLDAWVTTHREELAKRVGEVKVNTAETRLFVTLCYRECATDMIPIPGEPCRRADETVAASRVADDFRLELRFEPPAQREEDALREYAEWLGQIEVTNDAGASPNLEDVIRKMLRGRDEGKGSSSLMTGPPPASLKIQAKNAARDIRTALNLWVTEIRPRVQSWRPEIGSGLDAKSADKGEECLLLAELRVPLKRASSTAVWRVGDPKGIEVIEERRPVVAHVRMLQELLLNVGRAAKQQPPAYQTMAAGMVKGTEGSGGNEFNNLRVTKTGAGFVSMTFDGYEQPDPATAPFQYIVKALLVLPADSTLTTPSVTFLRFEAAETGFTLSVKNAGKAVDKAALANLSFMVEVSRYATGGKDNKETKEKDAKETKDTKETKEKDTKESKDTKDTKEKEKEKEKDTKETKEKDTKETKEKDTKETKEKDTKETKEKDTKETKEKDTKETKEKDTKETKEKVDKELEKVAKEKEKVEKEVEKVAKEKEKAAKELEKVAKEKEKVTKEAEKAVEKAVEKAKEKESSKDTKEAKEEKASQDKLKDGAALKEREQLSGFGDPKHLFAGSGDNSDETAIAEGRAFIRTEERPEVGRRALELADEPSDEETDAAKPEDVGKPVDAAKPGEASGGKQAEAIN